jgi:ABC-type multidrug transport system fused ATPase/permease subunit
MIRDNKLSDSSLTLSAIMYHYWRSVGITWFLTLIETALSSLVPLLIGYAIDGLLEDSYRAFVILSGIMVISAVI